MTERATIRCLNCDLVQFATGDARCRRCHVPFFTALPATAQLPVSPTENLSNFAGAIRAIRELKGLNQKQLAARMKVPRSYISKLECRRVIPRMEQLVRLAAALEVSMSDLLNKDGATIYNPLIREIMPYVSRLTKDQRNYIIGGLRSGNWLAQRKRGPQKVVAA